MVVFTDFYEKDKLIEYNEFCRKNNIGFIFSGSLGLYGFAFVDFGEKFTVIDSDGEQPAKGIIVNIARELNPLIQCESKRSHGLYDSDTV